MYQQELFTAETVDVPETTAPVKKLSYRQRARLGLVSRTMSPEAKEKISEAKKAYWARFSPEERSAMSNRRGAALSPEHKAAIIAANTGLKKTPENLKQMSESRKGKPPSPECMKAAILKLKGAKLSEEHRRKIGIARSGDKSNFWKGGIGGNRDRANVNYVIWRDGVFNRDNYTCQGDCCRPRGCALYAHHIKPWSKYPELRYELDNGISLCGDCHAAVDEHFAKFWNNRKELKNKELQT